MRKLTDPGMPAPPAPGSVRPSRSPTPGAYQYTSEDDVPTKPDEQLQPELLKLVRIVDSMPTVERRRFIALAESYQRCGLGPRVLIEELARELAMKGTT